MQRAALATIILFLLAVHATPLPSLEVKSYWNGHQFVTDGTIDPAPWHEAGLATIRDYDHYDQWALRGLDGKDPVSATFWENFQSFVHDKPDSMLIKMTLRLPKPFGIIATDARFAIDESRLADGVIRFTLASPIIGVNKAFLLIAVGDSTLQEKVKRMRFRIIFVFAPLFESILRGKEFEEHMRLVTGLLARNLEAWCTTGTP